MAEGNHNSDGLFFLIIAMIAGGCWLFWHIFHEQVIYLLRWVRYGEMWVLNRIVDNPEMRQYQDYFFARTSTVTWPHIAGASLIVGHYISYPVAGILALCALWVMFRAPKSAFKHAYGLDRLIAAQAKVWPVITPFINFNPAAANSRDPTGPLPDKLPIFAEALSPDEWMRLYKITRMLEGIDREAASTAFAAQLGPRWKNARSLPLPVRALFAVCALKIARKRRRRIICWAAWRRQSMPRAACLSSPIWHSAGRSISSCAIRRWAGRRKKWPARHAFATPAMLHVLNHARDRGGVLAPAQFVWLRGINRALWYPLNNLGRQAFHAEAAGAMAHYEAELAANRPLLTPKVQAAVDALQKYSHDNPFTPTLQLTG